MQVSLTLAGVLLGTFGPAAGADLRTSEELTLNGVPFLRIQGRANEFVRSDQNNATLAVRPDGSFAVAWQSRRQNSGLPGVFVRRFDRHGRPLSAEMPASLDRRSSQLSPALVWAEGAPLALYGTRFRAGQDSAVFAGDSLLNRPGIGSKSGVSTATAPDGTSYAVWLEEVRHDRPRVWVRVLGPDGRAVSPPSLVSTAPGGRDVFASVAADDEGAVVVWHRFDSEGRAEGVFGQRVGRDGARVGDRVRLSEGNLLNPAVAIAGGRVAMAAVRIGGGETYSVETVFLDRGLASTSEPVSTPLAADYADGVAIAGRADGCFAVAWSQVRDAESGIMGQRFDPRGNPQGDTFAIVPMGQGTRTLAAEAGTSRLAYTSDGLTVAWSGDGGIADRSGVYFTLLVEKGGVTASARAELEEAAARTELVANRAEEAFSNPKLEFVRVVKEGPSPHTPPLDVPWQARNEWNVSYPSSTGGFNAWTPTTFTPPDPDVAIGPDDIVTVVNDGISFHKKDGTVTFRANMRFTNGFWGSFASVDDFIYDPECFYDYSTGRWWVMATQGAQTGPKSYALVAVSATGDPNGSWYKYQFDASSLAGNFFDSPNFGVDPNVLYVTGDGFGLGANYPVFTFDKASLLAGNPPAVTRSTTLATTTQSAGIPPTVDAVENAYYMVEHQEGNGRTQISLIALRDPLGSPNFQRFQITVPAYGNPENPPQQGTSTRPTAFDARFWSVKYRNGSIWATHHASNPVQAHWYEIKPNGWPVSGNDPVLVQAGKLNLGGTIRTSFSSIAADPAGNAALAYARSATNEFLSSAYSTRKRLDPLGTMPVNEIARVATGPYNSNRWGDYSGVEADPAYPGLFWSHHEWAEGNSWRTWVQPFRATTEVVGTGIRIFRGIAGPGSLQDTLIDDGSFFRVFKGLVQNSQEPPVSVVLSSRSWLASPASLSFKVKARVSTAGLYQRIELFDWQANAWVQVDQRAATTGFQTTTVAATNPARFVRPGKREIEARISFGASGPVASNNWNADYDLLSWDIQ